MSGKNGILSPISVESNDWSPVSKYQNLNGPDNPYSPSLPPQNRAGSLITPPASGHTSTSTTDGMQNAGMQKNPSPPASVARSSDGVGLYAQSMTDGGLDGRKQVYREEALAEHHAVLKGYLAPYLRDERGNLRPNRARDKLLRLSPIQFQELSTDVYDESLRREDESLKRGNTPDYLPPKNNFHPKRNQARQKLSTLPLERFRQLATDVYYELERRFPRFGGVDIDRAGSPALSVASSRGGPPRRMGTPNNMNGGPNGFRGPPPPGRGGPPGAYGGGPPGGRGPPPPGAGRGGEFGRPLPKTFQSNTIVPNKGLMIEEDDDQSGDEDNDSDAFGLEGAAKGQVKKPADKVDGARAKELQAQVSLLQDKIDSLEGSLRDKDAQMDKFRSAESSRNNASEAERREWQDLRQSLERRLEDANGLNDSLKSELEMARSDGTNAERKLRSQLEEARGQMQEQERDFREQAQEIEERMERERAQNQARGAASGPDDGWMSRCGELERELAEQQQVTDEVRREAAQFLQEMRGLSEKSSRAMEKEERLEAQVQSLEAELRDWKARYARAKTQIRHLKTTSSFGLMKSGPDAAGFVRDGNLARPDGVVRDVHVTKYQLAVDELLQTARNADPDALLESMKHAVLCVRHIIADIDAAFPPDSRQGQQGGGGEDAVQSRQHQLAKLKARVSATANNLITATKNHAAASGLAPVSLLDAAASHLATAVVELVRAAKVRPTPPGELDRDDGDDSEAADKPMPLSTTGKPYGGGGGAAPNGAGGYGAHLRSRSKGSFDSVYSTASSPRPGEGRWSSRRSDTSATAGMNGAVAPPRNEQIVEFRSYLDDQTAALVHSIQPLVHSIRSRPAAPTLTAAETDHISAISRSVQDTVMRAAAFSPDPPGADPAKADRDRDRNPALAALARHAPPVVAVLAECRDALLRVVEDDGRGGAREKVPPLAFRTARAMKELVLRVERIEGGEVTAGMSLGVEI